MKRSIRLLCFLYVLCCTVFVVAQPYAIQHLGVENGLSNNLCLVWRRTNAATFGWLRKSA